MIRKFHSVPFAPFALPSTLLLSPPRTHPPALSSCGFARPPRLSRGSIPACPSSFSPLPSPLYSTPLAPQGSGLKWAVDGGGACPPSIQSGVFSHVTCGGRGEPPFFSAPGFSPPITAPFHFGQQPPLLFRPHFWRARTSLTSPPALRLLSLVLALARLLTSLNLF